MSIHVQLEQVQSQMDVEHERLARAEEARQHAIGDVSMSISQARQRYEQALNACAALKDLEMAESQCERLADTNSQIETYQKRCLSARNTEQCLMVLASIQTLAEVYVLSCDEEVQMRRRKEALSSSCKKLKERRNKFADARSIKSKAVQALQKAILSVERAEMKIIMMQERINMIKRSLEQGV
ncbi:hypothetical protein BWQ96_03037 [Gracilariopsis chorda]|uniref:Uncharacterized protein n=1 Tax=Gracilariopsis chorda TaxID=448386 RepID=A0A2V3IYN1_9FLOR|nr:hypothetical protein BWQ96_03037 [Gracilariopsis chorda]|eukprot:PXF47262.1 hypothetical protein BWQ96_03037 [Gracilariopsis chorda]